MPLTIIVSVVSFDKIALLLDGLQFHLVLLNPRLFFKHLDLIPNLCLCIRHYGLIPVVPLVPHVESAIVGFLLVCFPIKSPHRRNLRELILIIARAVVCVSVKPLVIALAEERGRDTESAIVGKLTVCGQ